jgi:hypothetical protein
MYAFNEYVFAWCAELFTKPLPKTAAEFRAQFKNAVHEDVEVKLIKARFKINDAVILKRGRIPKFHNSGFLEDDVRGVIVGAAMLTDGYSASAEYTRIMYRVQLTEDVGWVDIESDYLAKARTIIVVQQSSLMVKDAL